MNLESRFSIINIDFTYRGEKIHLNTNIKDIKMLTHKNVTVRATETIHLFLKMYLLRLNRFIYFLNHERSVSQRRQN